MEHLNAKVTAAKKDSNTREELIQSHKSFIQKYSSVICKKYLNWENDDELSIALMAFNEAIDKFNPEKSSDFLGFAKHLIRLRLIDYYRKESKHVHLSLEADEEFELTEYEVDKAIEQYEIQQEKADKSFEMKRFQKLIRKFGITLDNLTQNSPSHKKTRDKLKKLAIIISKDKVIINKLLNTHQLPVKEITIKTGMNRKMIERWRCYLISLIIILVNDELLYLRNYIFPEGGK